MADTSILPKTKAMAEEQEYNPYVEEFASLTPMMAWQMMGQAMSNPYYKQKRWRIPGTDVSIDPWASQRDLRTEAELDKNYRKEGMSMKQSIDVRTGKKSKAEVLKEIAQKRIKQLEKVMKIPSAPMLWNVIEDEMRQDPALQKYFPQEYPET